MHWLGIDIGSYSAKGVLLDAGGHIVATATQSHRLRVPQPGWAEHDALQDWWGGFTLVLATLLAQAKVPAQDIAAVALSGIGPCTLPVDAQGLPLRNAILYGIDSRAQAEMAEFTEHLGAEAVLQRTGNPISTQAVGPKLLWLKRHEPEVFNASARFIGCPTYLVHRLTGRYVVDHYGAAACVPFYDIEALAWHEPWVRKVCRPEQLPELAWSTDIAGPVTPEAAALTGLAAGTPVIVGTVDAASEAVSVGVMRPGDLMAMYGTSMFFIQVTRALHRSAEHWAAPFLFPGTWAATAGVSTAGALTQWLTELLLPGHSTQAAMAELADYAARSPPGARRLLALPYFSGERTPINDPQARGLLFGLNLTHNRDDLARALLEGMGHATRQNLEALSRSEPALNIQAVGGGVHNSTWLQSTVDICGQAQQLRRHSIGAALGNAFLAGLALKHFRPEDMARINPPQSSVVPRGPLRAVYDRDHALFRALYMSTRHLMPRLAQVA